MMEMNKLALTCGRGFLMENEHQLFLRRLHGLLSFTNCAGDQANVRSLHQNRLVERRVFKKHILDVLSEIPDISEYNFENLAPYKTQENLRAQIQSKSQAESDTGAFMKFLRTIRDEMLRVNPELEQKLTPHTSLAQFLEIRPSLHYNKNLHTIFGDPGYGKTVHIKQIAERFVHNLRRTDDCKIMPIFLKAKDIATSLEKNPAQKWIPLVRDLVSESLGYDIDTKLFSKSRKNIVLFVDAYDECRNADLHHVTKFLSDVFWDTSSHVVLTSRYSHIEKVKEMEEEMKRGFASLSKGHNTINVTHYHIDFTKNELCDIMPEKLLIAWGVDDYYTNHQIKLQFASYKDILTHPVFVGIFSLMVHRGDKVVDPTSLDGGKLVKLRSSITNHHIRFIEKVIYLGIELALERFEGAETERFVNIFTAIAWAYLVSNEGDLDSNIQILKLLDIIEITPDEINIIKKGIGLLYSTDGETLDWVHKTIIEVGAAQFVHRSPQHIHYELIQSDCFMIALIIGISDDSGHNINDAPITRLASFFSGELSEDVLLQLLTHHPSWETPLFKSIEVYILENIPRLRLERLPELDKRSNELAIYLEECSISGKKIPAHPFQFKHCLEQYLQLSDHFYLQEPSYAQVEKLLKFIDSSNIENKIANDYLLRTHLVGETLEISYGMWLRLPDRARKHIFGNVERWKLMNWFSKRYPSYIRINSILDSNPSKVFNERSRDTLKQMETVFADLFKTMKEKIDHEFNLLMNLGVKGTYVWNPESTLEKFAYIYHIITLGKYPDGEMSHPTVEDIVRLIP